MTVGADGSLFDASLPPFLRYAIVADGDIEFDAFVTIEREDNAPLNSSVFANNNLKVKNFLCRVEGFGYHEGGVDEEEALQTFAPRYNPAGLQVHQKVDTKMAMPEFDPQDYQHLATRFTDGDLYLSGHYDLGTEDEPEIWYVDGKIKTIGSASFSGYGVFLSTDDVELAHSLTANNSEGVIAFYTDQNFKVKEEAGSVTLSGQILANQVLFESDVTIYGSITATDYVKFLKDITGKVYHRPAHRALTKPFWN